MSRHSYFHFELFKGMLVYKITYTNLYHGITNRTQNLMFQNTAFIGGYFSCADVKFLLVKIRLH